MVVLFYLIRPASIDFIKQDNDLFLIQDMARGDILTSAKARVYFRTQASRQ